MISAIILASGNSTRLGNEMPKQFLELENRQLMDFPISTFASISEINEIIIVVPKNSVLEVSKKYPKYIVVEGGKTRKESSYNGLLSCDEDTSKVLIHDAARIFVSPNLITRCIDELSIFDAVTPAISVIDTIAFCEKGRIKKIDPRSNLKAVQTPQGFDYIKIKNAHEQIKEDATDDIGLMLKLGFDCFTINGEDNNFKITTQADLQKAVKLLKDNK